MIILLLILFGLAIGSFLNVVIYRTVYGESFLVGRSKCPHCEHQISWYDNIPVVSYLVLRGHCRNCKKHISLQYPAVEIMTAALFLWWYGIGSAFFQLSEQPLSFVQKGFWLFVGICLIIIMVTDYLYQIIPDGVVLALTGITFVYRFVLVRAGIMQVTDFYSMLLAACGASLFFLFLHQVTKGRGMGLGDVKFAFPMGLLLGFPGIFVGIFLSFVIGACVGILLLVTKQKKIGQTIPFGPFLIIGTVITLVWGNSLLSWYLQML